MARGDHIWVRHWAYTHHGIDVGDGTVIHFAGKPGRGMRTAQITRTLIADFAAGRAPHIRTYATFPDPEVVLARAESRIGESGYRLLRNNCEHFATWCRTGHARSGQVRDDTLSAGAIALAAAVVVARHSHLVGHG